MNFPNLLELRDGCPPLMKMGLEHAIHTGTEVAIKVRPRQHVRDEHATIDKEVQVMLRDVVIEEGSGDWEFPVVLVRKKDGSVWFCIDYRLVNAITKRDVYPLTQIDDTLVNLHGAKRLTSRDLHSVYWKDSVASQDRDKTAFVTRQGLLRFSRMPFGLAHAPGTFQRMVDTVLRGITWQSCVVYLDDVIVLVAWVGTSWNWRRRGMPMPSLVSSVASFPVPVDASEVKRFVHMAEYYRRFVPEFVTKAAPLTKLLPKGWSELQQAAFEYLKSVLTERPLLTYPVFTRSFRLITDASKVGLWARIKDTESNPWPTRPRSIRLLVWNSGVGRETSQALPVWIDIHTGDRSRGPPVADDFQEPDGKGPPEYDFEIEYRPGKGNVVADALARAPVNVVVGDGRRGERREKPGQAGSDGDG
ncbi:Retroelement [Phytophthora megakarya]|uniref:Retroelement n=1 Tax=Phytophthora megakarya TaxID=4795 RepID=A0A225WF18_9STRA|nr:Retroelement [Phytophthora megakarya]